MDECENRIALANEVDGLVFANREVRTVKEIIKLIDKDSEHGRELISFIRWNRFNVKRLIKGKIKSLTVHI